VSPCSATLHAVLQFCQLACCKEERVYQQGQFEGAGIISSSAFPRCISARESRFVENGCNPRCAVFEDDRMQE
jgi:hypothetical protein